MRRSSDQEDILHFRSERTLQINGEWYFVTREGPTIGPFLDKKRALECLASYLEDKATSASNPFFDSIWS